MSVFTWGDNSNGQLGDGGPGSRATPTGIAAPDDIRQVEAGSGHVLVVLDDGSALSWGRNIFGQTATGGTDNRDRPAPVRGLPAPIRSVSLGGGHTLYLLADGTVWASGAGFFGCLGDSAHQISPVPIPVEGLPGPATQVVAGGGHSLALLADGSVWTWGRDDYGQLGDAGELKPGHATQEHMGKSYPVRFIPARVEGLPEVASLYAGGGQSLALLADGSVLAWGFNDCGQLGDGTTTHRAAPAKIDALSGVRALAGAYHHTLALLEDGTVRAFGLNDRGQLGNGRTTNSSTPVATLNLTDITAIAAVGGGSDAEPGNAGHSVALRADGTVWSWGCNDNGELGDGTTESRATPVQAAGLSGVRHITVGGEVPQFRENPGGGYTVALA
ncbi:RCC1-like domain-containing protein [Actinokineospora enzanensis]|uniref:RCC1-like domain-containing protein n=1 Tax=Actinokineospora enzanensis TaxID=155975 RepID=UPI000380238B|nr:RCC1 domain-containing protein [Actinokineospora enzanensis]